MPEEERLPLVSHLSELRNRIIKSLIAVLFFSILAYIYSEKILASLKYNFIKELVALSPTEAFITKIKLSIYVGIFLASPFIIYQALRFILPALYKKEKKYLWWLLFPSVILFLCGAAFSYFLLLPFTLRFLLTASSQITPFLSVKNYISFIGSFLLIGGAIFELPLVLLLLLKIGIIKLTTLKIYRKYVILLFFIVAAAITPTQDIITQSLIAIPLIVLYELVIIIGRIFFRHN